MADDVISLPRVQEFWHAISDRDLSPLFWRAELVNPQSAWCAHIPFAHWIVAATRPRVLVELGTHTGVSYSAFCLAVEREQLATQCYAVDTWQGDKHAGFYGDEVFAGLARHHYDRFGAFSTLLRCSFDQAREHFADSSIDLLHIDGLHTYEAVRHDFECWLPRLSDQAVVLFHDTNVRQDDFGVWRLWEELRQRYPSFEFFHGHGLGILAVGPRVPAPVVQLCDIAEPGLVAILRDRVALLGERWEAEQRERLGAEQAREAGARDRAAQEARITSLQESLQRAEASSTELQESLQRAEAAAGELQQGLNQAELRRQAELNAARKALEAAQREAANERSKAEEIAHALATARARETAARERAEQLATKAEAKSREAAQACNRAEEARCALEIALQEESARRAAIENSTMWRVLSPVRHQLEHHPGARRRIGAMLRLVRSGVRPGSLQQRRIRKLTRTVAASPLFDADWYLATYPDVAASSLSPAEHYALFGGTERRNPGPEFDAGWYLDHNPDVAQGGFNPLLHYIDYGKSERRQIRPVAVVEPPPIELSPATAGELTLAESFTRRFVTLAPLNTFSAAGEARRLTMLTDSINAGSLFGGVGTAIVLSALLARNLGIGLRLITRSEPPDTGNLATVLRTHRVAWDGDVEFLHVPYGGAAAVPVGADEIFLTTSWWTTRSVRPVIPPGRIFYLLQEDERMFYGHGDDRLRCGETLADPDIRFIVNSEMLFDYLVNGCEPLPNINGSGVWFEPAFPAFGRGTRHDKPAAAKRIFFFYARPTNERNLYWRGLEAIGAAIEEGVLDADRWELHFAGRDLTQIELPCGIRPHLHENLPWPDYAQLVERADVGLSLMDTPHPSYPPLDLAAAGAIAVTNSYGPKTSLTKYSKRILCVEPSVEALRQGIAQAVALSDDPKRMDSGDGINRDWEMALAPVLKYIASVTA